MLGACERDEPTDCCAKVREEPACCAIAPIATCRSSLLELGVTQEETDIVLGPREAICPSERLSEERLRHVASLVGPKCDGVITAPDMLATLTLGACAPSAAPVEVPAN
jgi:hypothetical protein